MVHSKTCSRSTLSHKVINYTSNGKMLHFFWNTLHWLLYIDILIIMFWMYYKDNIGVENHIVMTFLVRECYGNPKKQEF
jgi:hypothetical protein